MVRVTLKVPDNTVGLAYLVKPERGAITGYQPVTAGMIVEAEWEEEPDERE